MKDLEKDLERLIYEGHQIYLDLYKRAPKEKRNKAMDELARKSKLKFNSDYERWYTESRALIKQIIPDRLVDFENHYKREKRKNIDFENYTISDYLIGLSVISYGKEIDSYASAFMRFQQQMQILTSAQARFESSLFNIQQLVRADIFDSELDGARELIKSGFLRAAGVVAGVVSEKHLEQVCINHNISMTKRNPKISDYNDKLKEEEVIDVPNWRFIQRIGDLRNLCCHHKKREPKEEEVEELVDGVDKITKTLF